MGYITLWGCVKKFGNSVRFLNDPRPKINSESNVSWAWGDLTVCVRALGGYTALLVLSSEHIVRRVHAALPCNTGKHSLNHLGSAWNVTLRIAMLLLHTAFCFSRNMIFQLQKNPKDLLFSCCHASYQISLFGLCHIRWECLKIVFWIVSGFVKELFSDLTWVWNRVWGHVLK